MNFEEVDGGRSQLELWFNFITIRQHHNCRQFLMSEVLAVVH